MKKLLLFFLLTFALAGCSDDLVERCQYPPKVVDQTDQLSNKTKELFLNFDFPFGVYPVLYTVDKIEDKVETGSVADDIFKQLAKDKDTYPDFKEVGFLVVVSQDPELIQVRMGRRYKSYCDLTGVTAGDEYLSLQKSLPEDGINKSLTSMLEMVSVRVDERNALSGVKKWRISGAITTVENLLDYVGTPSENFYGRVILTPLMALLSSLNRLFGSWGFALIVLFGVAFLIKYMLKRMLYRMLADRLLLAKVLDGLFNLTVGLFFSLSAAGAAFLLSNGRMEDMIALEALGVPFVDHMLADASTFNVTGSFMLVSVFVIMWALKLLLNDCFVLSLLPEEAQQSIYRKNNGPDAEFSLNSAPYSAQFTSYLIQVGADMFFLAIAACFLLPEVLIWIGVALALFDFISNVIQLRTIMKQAVPQVRNVMSGKIFRRFAVILVECVVILVIASFLDPRPERKQIDYAEVPTEVISAEELEGLYTLESRSAEGPQYATAELKNIGEDQYRLLVTRNGNQRVFTLDFEPDNLMFYSEDLGYGKVKYNKALGTLKVEFKVDYETTWTFSK